MKIVPALGVCFSEKTFVSIKLYKTAKTECNNTANEIIKFSRHNNKSKGITGYMLICGEFFLERLEGKKYNVLGLIEKIKN